MSSQEVFLEIHAGLPRQGVGSDDATLRALELCTELPAAPDILDIGCGPGAQTLMLARATDGAVTAVDRHAPFLRELERRAAAAGLEGRITTVESDMAALPFPPASFDLVWSEGAAYSMGVGEALAAWRPLLRPGGYLVFSELCWTEAARPHEVVAFFTTGYPAMTDVRGNLGLIDAAGYELVGSFALPEAAWWDEYYAPLEARLSDIAERHRGGPEASAVIRATASEIDLRRRFPDAYDYVLFVTRVRPGPA